MRYLAIDYGLKRTGLAVCDKEERLVSPYSIVDKANNNPGKIAKIIKEEEIEAVIVGLPYNMDGSEGGQAKIVRKFTDELKKILPDIEIHFQDERLSTFSAKEKLAEAEFTTGKRKKRLDAVAAAEILQSFLDCKNI